MLFRKTTGGLPASLITRSALSRRPPTRSLSTSTSVQVLLRRRPGSNEPVTEDCFEVVRGGCGPPAAVCAAGQLGSSADEMLYCRTLYLSVDPFLRCRFNEKTGVDYTAPYEIGKPITSAGIGQVLAVGARARAQGFSEGDLVVQPFDSWQWATATSVSASSVGRVPPALAMLIPPSALLGATGQPGLTALCGVDHVAQPAHGETVVVSGAAGAVGALACQLFRRRGCHVVGLCGSDAKAAWLRDHGLVDEAINYKLSDAALGDALAASPAHVYWDNVGGRTSDLVVTRGLRPGARILVCGQISMYDDETQAYPPPLPPPVAEHAAAMGITRTRYLSLHQHAHFAAALAELCCLLASGALRAEETITPTGVADAPRAFVSMMQGGNVGKALVAADPADDARYPPAAWTVRTAERLRALLPPPVRGALASRFITPERMREAVQLPESLVHPAAE